MRYKKGSKVEVLIGNELPSGYWRCAEILCGNGHNYTVKCDMYQGATDEAIVERVSRKSIRPCPPSVGLSRNWIPGDIVEVLHNFAWKMATVSMVLDRNNFLVRFLGSSQEFKVRKFDIRVRQSWQDNKWTVIGNGPWNCEDGKRNERSTLVYNQNFSPCVKETYAKMNLCIKDDLISAKSKKNIQDPNSVSTRILKRESCYCHSQLEGHAGSARKFRLIGKGGKHYRVLAADPCLSPVKVDAVASPRKLLGHKHMSASLNNKTTGFPDMDEGRERSNDVVACSLAIGAQPIDGDNITSSVGSCSLMSNNSFGLPRHFSADPVEDSLSDAESTCQGVYKEGNGLLPSKEELTAEIHRLELHAYHRTMEALHASGPLSWEQETLVTDLRLSLHISNEEHLLELRNLISTATSIPIS